MRRQQGGRRGRKREEAWEEKDWGFGAGGILGRGEAGGGASSSSGEGDKEGEEEVRGEGISSSSSYLNSSSEER